MSKAEDRALERCPKSENVIEEMRNERRRAIFIEGYHQAEKDNELTWEDMRKIVLLYERLLNDKNVQTLPIKDAYTELLKRFKEFKERKEK